MPGFQQLIERDRLSPIQQGGSDFKSLLQRDRLSPVNPPPEDRGRIQSKFTLPGETIKVLGRFKGEGECVGGAREVVGDIPAGLFTFEDKLRIVDSQIMDPESGMVAVMPAGKAGHLGVVVGKRGEDIFIYDVNADGHNTEMVRRVPKIKIAGYFRGKPENVNSDRLRAIQSQLDVEPVPQEQAMAKAANQGVDIFSDKRVEDAVKSENEGTGFIGAANAAKDKLAEQIDTFGNAASDILVQWADQPTFGERLGSLLKAPFQAGGSILGAAGKAAMGLAKGAARSVAAYPEAIKLAGITAGEMARSPLPPFSKETMDLPANVPPETFKAVEEAAGSSKKGLLKASAFLPTVLGQFVSGLANEMEKSREKGLPPSQMLGRSLLQGTEQGAVMAALQRLFGSKGDRAREEAKKAGVAEADIRSTERGVSLNEKEAMFRAAKGGKADRLVEKPFEIVGRDLNQFYDDASKEIKEAGRQIGEIKKAIRESGGDTMMDIGDLKKSIYGIFHKNGIKLKIGKNEIVDFSEVGKASGKKWNPATALTDPVKEKEIFEKMASGNIDQLENVKLYFSDSSVALNTGDQGMAEFLFDKVRFGKMDASDAPNLVSALQKRIYAGKGDIVDGKAWTEVLRSGVRKKVNDFAKGIGSPQLGDLNEKYHILSDIIDEYHKFAGSEGLKSPQILRRAMSNVGEIPKDFLGKVNEVSKKFGFESGKNLLEKADMAMAAENALGLTQPSSFKGQIKQAAIELGLSPGKNLLQTAVAPLKSAKEFLFPSPRPEQAFLDLIRSAPTSGLSAKDPLLGALSSGKGIPEPESPNYKMSQTREDFEKSRKPAMAAGQTVLPAKPAIPNFQPDIPKAANPLEVLRNEISKGKKKKPSIQDDLRLYDSIDDEKLYNSP